jgi:hypothetical protein
LAFRERVSGISGTGHYSRQPLGENFRLLGRSGPTDRFFGHYDLESSKTPDVLQTTG